MTSYKNHQVKAHQTLHTNIKTNQRVTFNNANWKEQVLVPPIFPITTLQHDPSTEILVVQPRVSPCVSPRGTRRSSRARCRHSHTPKRSKTLFRIPRAAQHEYLKNTQNKRRKEREESRTSLSSRQQYYLQPDPS